MSTATQAVTIYPAVRDAVSFHRYPGHRIAIRARNHGTRSLTWDAWQFYRLADGTRTIEQIAMELSQDWQIDSLDDLLSFCDEAVRQGYLELSANAKPVSLRVTGSETQWLPQRVLMELTDRCNLRCQYCYAGCTPTNRADLPAGKVPWLLSLLSRKGVSEVELSGGEPTIHPAFPAILKLALETFESVGLLTNGVHIVPEVLALVAAYHDKLNVQVSLDGSNERVNAAVRRTHGTFAPTLRTIQELLARGVPTRIGVVVTPENENDLTATCELLRALGARHVVVTMPDGVGRGAELTQNIYARSSPCWHRAVDLLNEAQTRFSDMVFAPTPEFIEEASRIEGCRAGCTNFAIDPRGDVKPCPLLPARAIMLGNIFTDDYDSLFNSSAAARGCQAFAIRTGEPACQACKYNTYCGKCMARVFLANKDRFVAGDGLCQIAQPAGDARGWDFNVDVPFKIDLTPAAVLAGGV